MLMREWIQVRARRGEWWYMLVEYSESPLRAHTSNHETTDAPPSIETNPTGSQSLSDYLVSNAWLS